MCRTCTETHASRDEPLILPEIAAEEVMECELPKNICTETKTEACESSKSDMNAVKPISSHSILYNISGITPKVYSHTGLECFEKFNLVLSTLLPAAYHLQYFNGPVHFPEIPEQFLLVLMKLRQNKGNFELGELFNVHEADVYNMFITWIWFMSLQ